MADKYELTIDGLQTEALVPFAEALGKISTENESTELNDNGNRKAREKAEAMEAALASGNFMAAAEISAEAALNPFVVAGKRIVPLYAAWGSLVQSPEDDVRELSRQFPANIFYLLCVSEMEEFGEIADLENFQKLRIQNGELTGVYDAEPVVWTSRYGY